jgi:hypothetical protein
MLARRKVEFPTLGYWPGFQSVATRTRTAFTGPFQPLAGCPGYGGSCTGEPVTLGALFSSGLDVSQWGLAEWGIAAIGAYMLVSTVFTTRRGVRRIGEVRVGRRKKRAARLKAKARALEAA